MRKQYEYHPLCTMFPHMPDDAFNALVKDIATNGLIHPITLFEGKILDGGHRYRACLEAEVEPTFVEHDGSPLLSFVMSVNGHRRHMNPGQQAMMVASGQDWENAQQQHETGNVTGHDTVADRMAMSGASDKTQRNADKVARADPVLAQAVINGEISLPKAVEKITGKKRKPAKGPEQVAGEPPYDPSQDRIAELAHTVTELAQENDRLRDAIAVGNMDTSLIDAVDALETLAILRQRVIDLEREVDTLRGSRDDYQMQVAELKRQCAMQRREIDKSKKAK